MRKFTKQITSMMTLVALGSSGYGLVKSISHASAQDSSSNTNTVNEVGGVSYDDYDEIGTTTETTIGTTIETTETNDYYEIGTTTSTTETTDYYEIGTSVATTETNDYYEIGTTTTTETTDSEYDYWICTTTTSSDKTLPEGMTMRGDATCNDEVDISDVILISRVASEDTSVDITEQGRINANCDGDDILSANDAATVLRIIAKLDS